MDTAYLETAASALTAISTELQSLEARLSFSEQCRLSGQLAARINEGGPESAGMFVSRSDKAMRDYHISRSLGASFEEAVEIACENTLADPALVKRWLNVTMMGVV